ncbi:MAG TPA: metalloregulator ArsR/SmtB family transcription factor [Polyangiaceae bacterium]|jgi:DNA-binding transcriptional ArsR family regulator
MSTSRAVAKKDAQLDAVFHALADSTRRSIVAGLARGPVSVGELAAPFAISLPAVSKHLDVLERAGLIRRVRDGRFLRCYLTSEPLEDAGAFIEHYRSFWHGTLEQLAEYVESTRPTATATRQSKGRK